MNQLREKRNGRVRVSDPVAEWRWGLGVTIASLVMLAIGAAFKLGSDMAAEPSDPHGAVQAIKAKYPALMVYRAESEFASGMSVTESDLDHAGSPTTTGQKPGAGQGAATTPSPGGKSPNPWKPITFSVYSDYYEGRRAADGSRFSQAKFTCASNSHKLGTVLELRLNSKDDGSCTVTVTDRMAKRFTGKRIDLSRAAWDYLTYKKSPGLAKGEWRRAK